MFKSIIVLGAALTLSACSQITPETPPVIDISETSEKTLQEIVTELEEIVEVDITTETIPEVVEEEPEVIIEEVIVETTPEPVVIETPVVEPVVENAQSIEFLEDTTPEPVVDTAAIEAQQAAARVEQARIEAEIAEEEKLSAEAEAAYAAEQEAARAEQARVAAEIAAAEAAKNEIKTLGSGQFVGVNNRYKGSGGITVSQMGDEVLLQIQGNFNVTAGPDLYLYISQPQAYGSTAKNGADLSRMKLISALSSNTGAQTYKISKADWDNYGHSIVIWCKAYSVRFSHATIN